MFMPNSDENASFAIHSTDFNKVLVEEGEELGGGEGGGTFLVCVAIVIKSIR